MKTPCPDEERLVDYLENHLSEKECTQVEEHLARCEKCLENMVITSGLMRDKIPFELNRVSAKITDAAVKLVDEQVASMQMGTLVNDLKRSTRKIGSKVCDVLGLRPWGIWQFSPIRGSKTVASEDFVSLRVAFKQVDTDIDIEKTDQGIANIRVTVHAPSLEKNSVRVTLKKREREVASYLLEGVSALFEDIPFGRYGLSLTEDGSDLGTYTFEIKESRHGGKKA